MALTVDIFPFLIVAEEIDWKTVPNDVNETSFDYKYLEAPSSMSSGCAHINGALIVAYVIDNDDNDDPMLKV